MAKNKRGAHFIEIEITDKELLEEIRDALGSNHKIAARNKNKKWKISYRLQIGSKEIFSDLLSLGMTPCKSKTIRLPKVPNKYFPHFVRGYFHFMYPLSGAYEFLFLKRKKRIFDSFFAKC
jgi:hypothetical protein